jgi:hypothetical protein
MRSTGRLGLPIWVMQSMSDREGRTSEESNELVATPESRLSSRTPPNTVLAARKTAVDSSRTNGAVSLLSRVRHFHDGSCPDTAGPSGNRCPQSSPECRGHSKSRFSVGRGRQTTTRDADTRRSCSGAHGSRPLARGRHRAPTTCRRTALAALPSPTAAPCRQGRAGHDIGRMLPRGLGNHRVDRPGVRSLPQPSGPSGPVEWEALLELQLPVGVVRFGGLRRTDEGFGPG